MKIYDFKKFLCKLAILIGAVFLFVLSICLLSSPPTAAAVTTSDLTFTLLSNDTYSVKATTKEISGSLSIPAAYNGKAVTYIGYSAFEDCSGLTSIEIPSSVTEIGNRAFRGCNQLNEVTISSDENGLMRIGDYAFYGCSGLTEIVVPKNVTYIGSSAFEYCSSLTNIKFYFGITSIGMYAFRSCSALREIVIPESVTSIGTSAFGGIQLNYVEIPDSVTSIGKNVFASNKAIPKVVYYGTSEQWNGIASDLGLSNATEVICMSDAENKIDITLTTSQERGFAESDNVLYTNGEVTISAQGYKVFYQYGYVGGSMIDAILSGESITITQEGHYYVWVNSLGVENQAYFRSYREFVIDKTAPDGFLHTSSIIGFRNGSTNGDVHFTWVIYDKTHTAMLNNKPYTDGAVISEEGSYIIKLTDLAGNSKDYKFEIDKTAPKIKASTTQSGGFRTVRGGLFTNGDVTFTDRDSDDGSGIYERTLNDVVCTATPGTLSEEGYYTYRVYDAAGNSDSYTVTILKTAPRVNPSVERVEAGDAFYPGNFTNRNVGIYTYSHPVPFEIKLNGKIIEAGLIISNEGTYTAVATDEVGNSSSETFTIDKTAPTGILTGVTNGWYTNTNVSLSWTNADPSTATLNGSAYTSGTTIRDERAHTITLTDRAGNSTMYYFTIDKTAPTGTLTGVENGGYTNTNVSLSWTRATSNEAPISATLNGNGFSSGASVTSERKHTLVLSDRAGNSTTYIFTIDKTAPTCTLTTTQSGGFKAGNYTNGNVTLNWVMPSNDEAPISATLNGKAYASGTAVRDESGYAVILTDRAGNSTSYAFTIDKTAPQGTLAGVENGGFTNKLVTFSWTAAAPNEAAITARLNGSGYSSGSKITAENEYALVLADCAGNSTSYTFVIDKTAPMGTLTTTQNGGFRSENYTNGNVIFAWSEAIGGSGSQRVNGKDVLTAKYIRTDFNGVAGKEQTYTRGALSAEGSYVVTLTDQTGNSTSYTFVIDKTKPVLLVAGSGVGVNAVYGNGAELSYSDVGSSVTGMSGVWKSVTISADGIEISEKAQETDLANGSRLIQGEYTVQLTDKAGNESETTFLCVGSVYSVNYEKLTHSGYLAAGTYKVTIPYLHSITLPAVGKDGRENVYAGNYRNSVTYVFASYENALEFMREVEIEENVTVNAAGLYTYYQLNNHNSKTTYGDTPEAKATMAEFYRAVDKYSKLYVMEYAVPNLGSAYIGANTVVVDAAVLANRTQDGTVRIGGDYVFADAKLTGKNYAYGTLARLKIEREGQVVYSGAYTIGGTFLTYVTGQQTAGGNGGVYEVTEYDSVGNEYGYTVFFDALAPSFFATYGYYSKYTDENGDMQSELKSAEIQITNDKQIDTNLQSLIITDIVDNADEIYNIVVTTPGGIRCRVADKSLLSFGEGQYFSAGGNYVVNIYDRTGNVFEYTFTIYGGAPRVSTYITGAGDNRTITIGFTNANDYSSIVRFDIYRYGEKIPEGEYREEADGVLFNTLYIDQNTWEYKFYLGGIYQIRFCDSFSRVTITDEILFTKGLPTYTLTGVENGGVTRKAVGLTFARTIGYEILKDGKAFERAAGTERDELKLSFAAIQADNGYYEIKLYRKSDVKTYVKVSFEIDTVPPTAEARYKSDTIAAWDGTVKEAFRISWTDDVTRVRYSRNGEYPSNYTEGTYLDEDGDYEITVTDVAGNSTVYRIVLDTVASYAIEYSGNRIEGKEYVSVGKSFTVVSHEWLTLEILRDGKALENARFDTEYLTEGDYQITVTDAVGNSAHARVVIDKTAPDANVARTDEYAPVTIEYDAVDVAGMSVKKDGKRIDTENTGKLVLTAWGAYIVELADLLGNKNLLSITILKRPPIAQAFTVTQKEVKSGETVNESIYFKWNETAATGRVKTDGGVSKAYLPETVLTEEGTYELVVTDEAGNKVTYQATIRKRFSYAILNVNGEKLTTSLYGGLRATTESFYVAEIDEAIIEVTKDGAAYDYVFGQRITDDGQYCFVLRDVYGNVESYDVLRKTTPPSVVIGEREKVTDPITVTIDGATTVTLTKTAVSVTKVVLSLESGYTFTEWGAYVLIVSDELGNSATVQFEIGKVPPVLRAYTTAGEAITESSRTNSGVILESNEDAIIRYTVGDGYSRIYRAGVVLSDEGVYTVVCTDEAGNSVSLKFEIDGKVGLEAVADGVFMKELAGEIMAAKYVEFSFNETVGIECAGIKTSEAGNGDKLRLDKEGVFEITFYDEAGNTAKTKVVIDFTPPAYHVSVGNNAVTKDDVLLVIEDTNDVAEYTLRRDGKIAGDFQLVKDNVFTEAGTYELTLKDGIGNSAQVVFTIKRGVTCNLSVPNGSITHDAVTLTVKDKVVLKTLRNGEETEASYEDGKYRFTDEGVYEITVTDEVGNAVSIGFEIDDSVYKKAFAYTLPVGSTCKLIKDGKEVLIDKLITGDKLTVAEDGEYRLTLQNGDKKSEYKFIIDTKLPALLINGTEYADGAAIADLKKDFTLSANKKECELEVYFNGARAEYSAGEKLSANGEYKVVIRDGVGNEATYVFEKEFTLNTGSIVFIVMCVMLVVLVVVLIVRRRIKMRIR